MNCIAMVEAMAVQSNYKIIKWYEDHGQTGTESSKRKEFQKLLVDAKSRTFTKVVRWRTYPVHLFVVGHQKIKSVQQTFAVQKQFAQVLEPRGFLGTHRGLSPSTSLDTNPELLDA